MWYRDDCHRKLVFFKNWTVDGCGSLSRWLGGGCRAMGNFYMNACWKGAFRTHDLIRGTCCFVVMAGRFFGRKCPETVGHLTIRVFFVIWIVMDCRAFLASRVHCTRRRFDVTWKFFSACSLFDVAGCI